MLVTMIEEAAVDANVRVILQSSWTDLTTSKSSNTSSATSVLPGGGQSSTTSTSTSAPTSAPVRVFHIGPCPHEWLFPRVCGVLHHGGAGTVAAGLRAGKPTLVCPFFGDQFFWGMALERAKVFFIIVFSSHIMRVCIRIIDLKKKKLVSVS
jgi:sterol 3beta-glucosyltransferase